MSTQEERIKHSERLHQKETKLEKKMRLAKAYGESHILKNPHKYHKTSPMSCGDPGCAMCGNPRKFFAEKTVQEKSFEQTEGWDD
jgi:hypothetical protein